MCRAARVGWDEPPDSSGPVCLPGSDRCWCGKPLDVDEPGRAGPDLHRQGHSRWSRLPHPVTFLSSISTSSGTKKGSVHNTTVWFLLGVLMPQNVCIECIGLSKCAKKPEPSASPSCSVSFELHLIQAAQCTTSVSPHQHLLQLHECFSCAAQCVYARALAGQSPPAPTEVRLAGPSWQQLWPGLSVSLQKYVRHAPNASMVLKREIKRGALQIV